MVIRFAVQNVKVTQCFAADKAMAAAEAAKEAAAEAARYASDSASVGSQKAKETAGAAYDAAGDAAGAAKHKGKKVSAVRAVSIAVRIPDACCCWPESISATADMVKRRLASCSSLQILLFRIPPGRCWTCRSL